jgi:hypothetical protein
MRKDFLEPLLSAHVRRVFAKQSLGEKPDP